MKKTIFAFLLLATIANLILLILTFTDNSSSFSNYKIVIGISFVVFGGLLSRQLLSSKKSTEE